MQLTETRLDELLDLAHTRSNTLRGHIDTPITQPTFEGYKELEGAISIKAEYAATAPLSAQAAIRGEFSEMGLERIPLAFENRQPVREEQPLDVFRETRQDYVLQLTVHYTSPEDQTY